MSAWLHVYSKENLREIGAAANSVDKAPLDKQLTERFGQLVDDLVRHEGLSESKAVEKAFQAMKQEINAHVNSVPARAMSPEEIAKLKELKH
jgi:HAMP domain-containing protein